MIMAFLFVAFVVVLWAALPALSGKKSELSGERLKLSQVHWPMVIILALILGAGAATLYGLASGEISGSRGSVASNDDGVWENARR